MVVQEEQGVAAEHRTESWLWRYSLGIIPSLSSLAKCSYLFCWDRREKATVEDEIKEKEAAISEHSNEVQVRSIY